MNDKNKCRNVKDNKTLPFYLIIQRNGNKKHGKSVSFDYPANIK